jgi:hypothetical protein
MQSALAPGVRASIQELLILDGFQLRMIVRVLHSQQTSCLSYCGVNVVVGMDSQMFAISLPNLYGRAEIPKPRSRMLDRAASHQQRTA